MALNGSFCESLGVTTPQVAEQLFGLARSTATEDAEGQAWDRMPAPAEVLEHMARVCEQVGAAGVVRMALASHIRVAPSNETVALQDQEIRDAVQQVLASSATRRISGKTVEGSTSSGAPIVAASQEESEDLSRPERVLIDRLDYDNASDTAAIGSGMFVADTVGQRGLGMHTS